MQVGESVFNDCQLRSKIHERKYCLDRHLWTQKLLTLTVARTRGV